MEREVDAMVEVTIEEDRWYDVNWNTMPRIRFDTTLRDRLVARPERLKREAKEKDEESQRKQTREAREKHVSLSGLHVADGS